MKSLTQILTQILTPSSPAPAAGAANPGNWRDMGDEDNYRLLLPSASYPAERYGAPFDYSRGARGDNAVAIAYTPPYSQGAMGDAEAVF